MGKRLHIVAAIGLAVAALAAQPALAKSNAPLGYQLMCLKTPAECRGGGKAIMPGSSETLAILKRVNAAVNRSITPRNDGAVDSWGASSGIGDCEDFVLAKRRELLRSGFSSSSLRIAYVKTREGEGHAILVVKTSKGDFVLDNLNGSVRPLSQSGYRMVSMSGADPRKWS